VRQYLALSIDSHLGRQQKPAALPAMASRRPAPPLVAYRMATCDHINSVALEQLEAAVRRSSRPARFARVSK
jgi:hypothetical protein